MIIVTYNYSFCCIINSRTIKIITEKVVVTSRKKTAHMTKLLFQSSCILLTIVNIANVESLQQLSTNIKITCIQ